MILLRIGFKVFFTAYGTGHRLIGWILVPLGVGSLAGLLRRSGKPVDKAP